MHTSLTIQAFAEQILQRPLYPYQLEIALAILSSINEGRGDVFTVMMARQSGKNQLSAVLEAFLLYTSSEGTIIKAAPTFHPQITNSRIRLLSLLDAPETRDRVWQGYGHSVGLVPESESVRSRSGPRVVFYSANPVSNVVGATADLLLEIDEAQDVLPEKFDRDFRPMGSTRNATTILYGTAWTEHTLLAQQRARNLELEQESGRRLHFEHDWQTLAALNPMYRTYVENEIARLGAEHITIRTQYALQTVSAASSFFSPLQLLQLQGKHAWEDAPQDGACYIAGMDVAGEERPTMQPPLVQAKQRSKRDSTVLSIARIQHNQLGLPLLEVVHQVCWTGKPHIEQYAATLALVEHWRIRTLVLDATGLGAGLASLLRTALGDEAIIPFTFTRASKSHLAYQLLSLVNATRLRLYRKESAPLALTEECWKQLRYARYRLPAPDCMDFFVDPADGHDDMLCSLALLTEALNMLDSPPNSSLMRPSPCPGDQYRF